MGLLGGPYQIGEPRMLGEYVVRSQAELDPRKESRAPRLFLALPACFQDLNLHEVSLKVRLCRRDSQLGFRSDTLCCSGRSTWGKRGRIGIRSPTGTGVWSGAGRQSSGRSGSFVRTVAFTSLVGCTNQHGEHPQLVPWQIVSRQGPALLSGCHANMMYRIST